MYKPRAEDVYVTPWRNSGDVDICEVRLFLRDNSAKPAYRPDNIQVTTFGYRHRVVAQLGIDDDHRAELINEAKEALVRDFDVQQAAKKHNFCGDLNNVIPVRI